MPDSDGYPTNAELEAITSYEGDIPGFIDVVADAWPHDFGPLTQEHVASTDGSTTYTFTTGGWSGCETVLSAVRSTVFRILFWRSSHRGGLHVYEVPDRQSALHLVALPQAPEPSLEYGIRTERGVTLPLPQAEAERAQTLNANIELVSREVTPWRLLAPARRRG